MKKKIILGVVLFIMMSVCFGCIREPETTEFTTMSLADAGLDSKPEEGAEIVRTPDQYVTPKENQEYQEELDDQYWFSMSNLSYNSAAESGSSCYFLLNSYLYVYDREEKQAALLCSDPVCSHSHDSDCNALVSNSLNDFLEYYNGYLYTLVVDQVPNSEISTETLNLYRISLDGTTKDFVAKVASAVAVGGSAYNIYNVYTAVIHRGYLYYMYGYGFGEDESSYYVNKSHVLYRISLDNPGEPEAICAMNYGGVCSGIQLEGHGSYLYFIQTGTENHMYRYNTESGQLEYIDIEEPEFYVVYGNQIIYYRLSDPDKYFYYNLKTQEQGIFYEAEEDYMLGCLIWDGTFFNRKLIRGDTYYMTICDEKFNEVVRYEYSADIRLYEYFFRGINIMASDMEQEWMVFDKLNLSDRDTDMESVEVKNFCK